MSGSTYNFFTLDNGGGDFTELRGIDDAGTAVGFFQVVGQANAAAFAIPLYGASTGQPAYEYLHGSYTVSGAQTEAYGIDNLGSVVGAGATVTGTLHGVSFGTTGANVASVANATALLGINDAGVAVGTGSVGAVVVTAPGGSAASLTVVVGSGAGAVTVSGTAATGIDDTNQVTGYYTVPGASQGSTLEIGFVGTLSGTSVLGASSIAGPVVTSGAATIAPTSSQVLGINDSGQIVGDYTNSLGTHGFVYSLATGAYTTIDEPAADADTVIQGINDLGQIVGEYVAGGVTHGFVADLQGGVATVAAPVGGSTIDVAAGSAGVALESSSNVTLVDPGMGNVVLLANVGSDTIDAYGNDDTVAGSTGPMSVGAAGSGDVIYVGSGGGAVTTAGVDTVIAASGTVSAALNGGGLLWAGAASVRATVAGPAAAQETVVGGSGALSVNFGLGGGVAYAGSGNDTMVGGGAQTTLVGGAGAATLVSGTGPTLIWGGSGSGVYASSSAGDAAAMVAGLGASTIFANVGSAVYLLGSAPVLVDDSAASGTVGHETLAATASDGAVTFGIGNGSDDVYAGAGQTAIDVLDSQSSSSIFIGGSGADTYTFTSGSAGSYGVYDFRPGTDSVMLAGLGADSVKSVVQGAVYAHGSTKLTLPDKTQVTFFGVHLTQANIG